MLFFYLQRLGSGLLAAVLGDSTPVSLEWLQSTLTHSPGRGAEHTDRAPAAVLGWDCAPNLAILERAPGNRPSGSGKQPSGACLLLARWPHASTCAVVLLLIRSPPGAGTICLGSVSVYLKLLLKAKCKTFSFSVSFPLKFPVQRAWSGHQGHARCQSSR